MYQTYWGLRTPPFANVPTEKLFYRSSQHQEALSRLLYVIEHQRGVAMLTGEVGCGKTTVIKALSKCLDPECYRFYLLSNPAMVPLDLLRSILLHLGHRTENGTKPYLLDQLQEILVRNAQRGNRTVLAIDEAHVIAHQETLEELRMLLNMQLNEQFLITIILLGQPPLLKRIDALQPLKERISVKYNLAPLDIDDTLKYIVYRLKCAGATRGLFTNESIERLYEYSRGIPLRVNNLCDRCLLIGFMRRSQVVDSRIVNDAIEDLH
jgi:type II secretory pathway predicted ATPase ExeA